MPNLVVTNHCNLCCPFCFACEYRADNGSDAASMMSVEELERQVTFAGVETVRFCGGEPTLHPDFLVMLERALAPTKRRVFVMTNGLWPDAVSAHIAALRSHERARIRYLVNILEPERYAPADRSRIEETLAALDSKAVTLGFTIWRPNFQYAPLLTLAESLGVRQLRYSVAAPTITDPRSWTLDPDHDFPSLATLLFALNREASRRGLELQSDCGYVPPCFFSDEELGELRRHQPGLEFCCHGPVDIGPDNQAWRCYGLYNVIRARTSEFESRAGLDSHLEKQTALLEEHLLFDRCLACELRGKTCGGGCYAFRLLRTLRLNAANAGIAIEDDASLLAAVPEIAGDRLHMVEHPRRVVVMARDADGTWAELSLAASELEILRTFDSKKTIAAAVEETGRRRPDVHLLETALRLVRRLASQNAILFRRP